MGRTAAWKSLVLDEHSTEYIRWLVPSLKNASGGYYPE